MPFSLYRLSKMKLLALGLLALVGITISAIGKLKPATIARPIASEVKTTAPAPSAQPKQEGRAEVVFIALFPNGFDQRELQLTGKKFVLCVDNRSGIEELTFQLDNDKKEKVSDKKLRKGSLKWRHGMDLTPGDYELTVVGYPKWKCKLNVSNK